MANADGRSSSNWSSVIALAEPLREALPPARIPELPAELALGLLVRGSPHIGHHGGRRLTGQQPTEPARDTPWWLGIQHARQHRQPLADGRGLVVDDVVDTRLAALDRNRGRRRGVFDVDVRPDATTAADDREPTLADRPGHHRIRSQADPGPRTVEAAVAQRETRAPLDRGHRLLQIEEPLHYWPQRPRRVGIEGIGLGLHRPARAGPSESSA